MRRIGGAKDSENGLVEAKNGCQGEERRIEKECNQMK